MTAPDGGLGDILYWAAPAAAVADAAGSAEGLAAFLSAQERESQLRFRRAEDRLDYAASHALFRLVAAWQLGLEPGAAAGLAIRRRCSGCGSTEHGKPSIDGAELSLSRSHGTVMVAAGPDGRPLGVDIEKIPAEIFAGFDEYAVAESELPDPHGPGFTDGDRIRLWVAKEAILKASGLGLALEPSAVQLVPVDASAAGVMAGRGLGPWRAASPGHPSVDGMLAYAVPAPGGYAAAVAARDGLPGRTMPLRTVFALDA